MKTAAIAVVLCVPAPLACGAEDPAPAKREAPAPSKADVQADPESDPKPDAKADDAAAPPSPGVIGMLDEAKVKTACTDLQMLRSAVEMFTALKGKCPPDLATLASERVIQRLRDDPWGHAFQLRCTELELRSVGPDGKPKTPDDVVLGPTGDACARG